MKTLLISMFCLSVFLQVANTQTIDQVKACEVLSKEEMAELIETTADNLIKEDMSFIENDRRSICHYNVNGKIGAVNIRIGIQSPKAQERRALEWNYSRFLKEGEKNMEKYEELADGDN